MVALVPVVALTELELRLLGTVSPAQEEEKKKRTVSLRKSRPSERERRDIEKRGDAPDPLDDCEPGIAAT